MGARRPTIQLLDSHTIDQIAAGEVIERPASVVKELVENSLDAGASRITVTVSGAGKSMISVSDDGIGMTEAEVRLCLFRHATSKIRSAEDLQHISSMGFRGEALPSIASVSRLTIKSMPRPSAPGRGQEVEADDPARFDRLPDDFEAIVRAGESKIANPPPPVSPHSSPHSSPQLTPQVSPPVLMGSVDPLFAMPSGDSLNGLARTAGAEKEDEARFDEAHGGEATAVLSGGDEEERASSRFVLRVEASSVVESGWEAGEPGTEITVRDLFFNTPARLKFLKTDSTELTQCLDIVSRLAVARPDVRFRFIHDRATVFETLGDGDFLAAVGEVWTREWAKSLAEVDALAAGIRIRGYVSPPYLTKANRTSQFVTVNGRVVRSRTLTVAIDQAYRDLTPERRYPILAIDLEIEPSRIDVNVSPTKSEVRFQSEGSVFEAIRVGVRQALLSHGMIPSAAGLASANAALKGLTTEARHQREQESGGGKDLASAGYGEVNPGPNQGHDLGQGVGNGTEPNSAGVQQVAAEFHGNEVFGGYQVNPRGSFEDYFQNRFQPGGRADSGGKPLRDSFNLGQGSSRSGAWGESEGEGAGHRDTVLEGSGSEGTLPYGWLPKPSGGLSELGGWERDVLGTESPGLGRDESLERRPERGTERVSTETGGPEKGETEIGSLLSPFSKESNPLIPDGNLHPFAAASQTQFDLRARAEASREGLQTDGGIRQGRRGLEFLHGAEGGEGHEHGDELKRRDGKWGGKALEGPRDVASPEEPESYRDRGSNSNLLRPNREETAEERTEAGLQPWGETPSIGQPFLSLLDGLRVIGQLFATFIVCETRTGLVLIDQHVAHERIHYERLCGLKGKVKVEVQPLLTPELLNLDKRSSLFIGDRLDELAEVGFQLERFGETDYLLRAAPAALRRKSPVQVLKNLIDEMADVQVNRRLIPMREQIWIMSACKMSVKAGDFLAKAEMEKLIYDLAETENPYLCPHGRPITVSLSTHDLLKLFKRVH